MFEQRPVEVLASYVLAMIIGGGALFAIQKYGQHCAKKGSTQ